MTFATSDGARLMQEAAELLDKINRTINTIAYTNEIIYGVHLRQYEDATRNMVVRLRDLIPAVFEAAGEPENARAASEAIKR